MNKTKKIVFSQGFVTILLVWGLCSPGINRFSPDGPLESTHNRLEPKPRSHYRGLGLRSSRLSKGLYIHGITVKVGEPILNPVIYDNDVYDDVFDDEWAYAMASLGEMNLAGLIVTPVLTDFWDFRVPIGRRQPWNPARMRNALGFEWIKSLQLPSAQKQKVKKRENGRNRQAHISMCNSSMNNIGRTPPLPIIVNIGGQSATLASAYILDPSIADKCVVYYTDLKVYNGHYRWASELVAAHFRVVSWGDDHWWIPKRAQKRMACFASSQTRRRKRE
jgi:hypothetical protein